MEKIYQCAHCGVFTHENTVCDNCNGTKFTEFDYDELASWFRVKREAKILKAICEYFEDDVTVYWQDSDCENAVVFFEDEYYYLSKSNSLAYKFSEYLDFYDDWNVVQDKTLGTFILDEIGQVAIRVTEVKRLSARLDGSYYSKGKKVDEDDLHGLIDNDWCGEFVYDDGAYYIYYQRSPKRKYKLGSLIFTSDTIDVTDPCYNKDVWCRSTVKVEPNTKYNVFVEECNVESCDLRNRQLLIIQDGVQKYHVGEVVAYVGVDAGLAGFFENKPDYSDTKWGKFCDSLRSDKKSWLAKKGNFAKCIGAFCESGFGDGAYPVYSLLDDNDKIVGYTIIFIDEDEIVEQL